MNLPNALPSIGYAFFAGLATGVGAFLALLYRKTNTRLLSVLLGFSAGVMIYVSFVEIFPESFVILKEERGVKNGEILAVLSFFLGMVLIALLDELIPDNSNPHNSRKLENIKRSSSERSPAKLYKTGIFVAIAVTIHNFPEGIAAFISGVRNPVMGVSVALAIAIHNIPEGISIAIPIYYSSHSRKKALWLSFLSGMSEPVGAILAMLILGPFITDTLFGVVFAAVAGIMVYISLIELLPAAREYGEHHLSMLGLMAGMGVMAVSMIVIS